MSSSTNAYEMAQAQFDKVADQLGLDQQVRDYLRYPMREFHVRIPVRMMMAPYVFPGLSRAAQRCARSQQGRRALCSQRNC